MVNQWRLLEIGISGNSGIKIGVIRVLEVTASRTRNRNGWEWLSQASRTGAKVGKRLISLYMYMVLSTICLCIILTFSRNIKVGVLFGN